jgi:hypothetical protein
MSDSEIIKVVDMALVNTAEHVQALQQAVQVDVHSKKSSGKSGGGGGGKRVVCVTESSVLLWQAESRATGRIEQSVHFLDIAELKSSDAKCVSVLHAAGDEWLLSGVDADALLVAVCTAMHASFPELVLHERLKLAVLPAERKAHFDVVFFKAVGDFVKSKQPLRNFARTYAAMCRHRKVPIRATLVAYLDSIGAAGDGTLSLAAARYHIASGADWLPLLDALRYTRALTRVELADCRLPSDAFALLTAALACNRQVRHLLLSDVQSDVAPAFGDAFALAGSVLQLTQLHIQDVALGDRGVQTLATKVLTQRKWPLRLLRLRQVGMTPAGVATLLGALRGDAQHILATLCVLDLGCCKIDAKSATLLGEVLGKAGALTELALDDMGALDLDAVGFGVSAGCPELRVLDISLAKLAKKTLPKQLAQVVSSSPYLHEVRAAGLALPSDVVVAFVCKSNIARLTLSDHEFGEKLGDVFAAISTMPALKALAIDSVLSPKSPIDALDMLKPSLLRLEQLSCRGGSARRATPSLLAYLVEALIGSAVQHLRVGGHEAGDALCVALNGVLTMQACARLERVEFDENKSSLDGIVAFADGLSRCRTVRHTELPMIDIGAILAAAKPSNNVAERVCKATERIQSAVARNALAGTAKAVALTEQMREQVREVNLLLAKLDTGAELELPEDARADDGHAGDNDNDDDDNDDGGKHDDHDDHEDGAGDETNEETDRLRRNISAPALIAPPAAAASSSPTVGPWRGGRLAPTAAAERQRKNFLSSQ